MGFYNYSLVTLGIIGSALQTGFLLAKMQDNRPLQILIVLGFFVYSLFISSSNQVQWLVEQQSIALKWGTYGFVEEEKDRPQFKGDALTPFKRCLVTNRTIVYFPEAVRSWRRVWSFLIIICFIIVTVGVYAGVMLVEYTMHEDLSGGIWVVYVTSFILAAMIKLNTRIANGFILYLNEYENHRTETQFDNNVIYKTCLFELCNNFGVLFYTTLLKGTVFDACVGNTCVSDLRALLIQTFVVRYIVLMYEFNNVFSKAVAMDNSSSKSKSGGRENKRNNKKNDDYLNGNRGAGNGDLVTGGGTYDDEGSDSLVDDDDRFFLAEISRSPFNGTFPKFTDNIIQQGLVALFIVALPTLPILALLENIVKIRLDAWNLCSAYRRPHITLAEDIGFFQSLVYSVVSLSAVTNTGILCFATATLKDFSSPVKLLIFFTVAQIMVMIRYAIPLLFLDTSPKWIKMIYERQQYIVGKYLHGKEDSDDAMNDDSNVVEGNLEDNDELMEDSARDALRKTKLGEDQYAQTEELEAKKRSLLAELSKVKELLGKASKTEVLNASTGIGETRHGLPLGRLILRLVEVQNLDTELNDLRTNIKVKILIQGYRRQAIPAGPPPGEFSETAVYALTGKDIIEFNQSLGPFAPIRTMDADVVFQVIDMGVGSKESVLATATVKLRDLHDQQQHDMVLHLKTRQGGMGEMKQSNAKLFVQMTFLYSNLIPLRTRTFHLQDELRRVEKELLRLRSVNA